MAAWQTRSGPRWTRFGPLRTIPLRPSSSRCALHALRARAAALRCRDGSLRAPGAARVSGGVRSNSHDRAAAVRNDGFHTCINRFLYQEHFG